MLKIYTTVEAQDTILRRDNGASLTINDSLRQSLERLFSEPITPEAAVARLLGEVRERGDAAIIEWTERIDGIRRPALAVPESELDAALARIPDELAEALAFAAQRIRRFHELQPIPNWTSTELGGVLGQRFTPVASTGVYVPGGTAPLPSSLLMSAIPAQVAGVRDIVITTPAGQPDGRIPDVILAAAAVAGTRQVYAAGGALAVGALAFGTETIPRVDKIVGPGNLFTTLAKQQVYGMVGIDGIYGPTETAVVADDSANPGWIAADLMAQAEHDTLASAILFTPSRQLATAVQNEIGRQIESLSRAEIIAQSLALRGGIVLVDDLDQACRLASDYAAEHTCLAVEKSNEATCIELIPNAGGLFVGEHSFEVLGDYVAGPSHTMPTGGTARFASPLNVLDFLKITSIVQLDRQSSVRLSPLAARIAQAESLTAHQNAAQKRIEAGA
jgi:histidinol dehydrogenase